MSIDRWHVSSEEQIVQQGAILSKNYDNLEL